MILFSGIASSSLSLGVQRPRRRAKPPPAPRDTARAVPLLNTFKIRTFIFQIKTNPEHPALLYGKIALPSRWINSDKRGHRFLYECSTVI